MWSFLIITVSCTQKSAEAPASIALKENTVHEIQIPPVKTIELQFSKTLREAVYFSNSLEREALKLILKDSSFQKPTFFSVLSFIVETNSGAKKSTPFGLDCGQYSVIREQKTIKIFKTCVKPQAEVANIKILEEDRAYEVQFLIKEWASVVGLSVTLTSDNVLCAMTVKDKKLLRLKCDNWSYQTDSDQIYSTVVRAKVFLFQRDAQKQFVIKGGFFKELVENKKIDIVVPLEGKIKIIEKEIKVIDEFVDRQKKESGVLNEKEEDPKKENSKEAGKKNLEESNQKDGSQESGQENFEKSNQEEQQEANQEKSQQTSSDASQRGGRGR